MKQLATRMQSQERANWCWSAVATSISRFRNAASPWTQCTLASAVLGQPNCCAAAQCDQDWFLDQALTQTGNLRSFSNGAQPMATIQHEVDGDLPLGVRIQWAGGGGHFVAIGGYDEANSIVTVLDPLESEPVPVDYDALTSSYDGIGSWSHSYFIM